MSKTRWWVFHDGIDEPARHRHVVEERGRLTVAVGDRPPKDLTRQLSVLLSHFLHNPGTRFSQDELRDVLWPNDNSTGQLPVVIRNLRKALDDDDGRILKTAGSPAYYVFLDGPLDFLEKPDDAGEPISDGLRLTTVADLRKTSPVTANNIVSMLDPQRLEIPFIGRETQLGELWLWLTEGPPVSFKVLAGEGGRGKTRLAVRLLEEIDLKNPNQWRAGFLEAANLTAEGFGNWAGGPTLVVIDDASMCADALVQVVRAVRNSSSRLRFLLIERGVDERFRWYRRLVTADEYGASRLFSTPLRLPSGDEAGAFDRAERRRLLEAALDRLHEIDGQPRLLFDEEAERGLVAEEMGDPLVILMAAIVSHERRDLTPLTYRRIDLADAIAAHEERRIGLIAQPEFLPLHMVAYITLRWGLSEAALEAACKEEREAVEEDSEWRLIPLKTIIAEKLLPGNSASGNTPLFALPIGPDIVGEIFIERVLRGSSQRPIETIFRAFLREPESVGPRLVNLIHDLTVTTREAPEDKPRRERVVGWANGVVDMVVDKAKASGRDPDSIDEWLDVLQRATELAKNYRNENPLLTVPCLARAYEAWGDLLGEVSGSQHEAAEKYAEALRQIKALALEDFAFWNQAVELAQKYERTSIALRKAPDYSLSAPFSIGGGNDGDFEALLTAHREMVRQLPIQVLPMYIERAQDSRNEALTEFLQSALRRYELVNGGDLLAVREEDAAFGDRQAKNWAEAGCASVALTYLDRSIPVWLSLAAENPIEFGPHLAASLSYKADLHCTQSHHETALSTIRQAAMFFRELARIGIGDRYGLAQALFKEALLCQATEREHALSLLSELSSLTYALAQHSPERASLWSAVRDKQASVYWLNGNCQDAIATLDESARQRNAFPDLPGIGYWLNEDNGAVHITEPSWLTNFRVITMEGEKATVLHFTAPPTLSDFEKYEDLATATFDRERRVLPDLVTGWLLAEKTLRDRSADDGVLVLSIAIRGFGRRVNSDCMEIAVLLSQSFNRYSQWLRTNIQARLFLLEKALEYYEQAALLNGSGVAHLQQELLLSRDIATVINLSRNPESPTLELLDNLIQESHAFVATRRPQFLRYLAELEVIKVDQLTARGRSAEALSLIEIAVQHWREAYGYDSTCLRDFTVALEGLSEFRVVNGQHAEALESTFEAIESFATLSASESHVQESLRKAYIRETSLLMNVELSDELVAKLDGQVKTLVHLASVTPDVFSTLLADLRLTRILYLAEIVDSSPQHKAILFESIEELVEFHLQRILEQPDKSGPILAILHLTWGKVLLDDKDFPNSAGDAVRRLASAITMITPYSSAEPYIGLAVTIRDAYVNACAASSTMVDDTLLKPLVGFPPQ